jgi:hypothetical protein
MILEHALLNGLQNPRCHVPGMWSTCLERDPGGHEGRSPLHRQEQVWGSCTSMIVLLVAEFNLGLTVIIV